MIFSALFRALKTPGLCAVMLVFVFSARQAKATYRADFFDTSKRPTITFDKGKTTWTLRNQGVERVVRYDTKTGGLETLVLRDLKTHHALKQAPGGEGEITFASPLLETPQPLTGGKVSNVEPGSQWTQPMYDDSKWKSFVPASPDRPDRQGEKQTSAMPSWVRVAVPAGRLLAGHAYALYLPNGAVAGGEIWVDGVSVAAFPQAANPRSLEMSVQPEQIDLPANAHVIAVKAPGGSAFLPVYLAEVGTSPPGLNLGGNWQLMQHTINTGEDNSQILTIALSGMKQYEGFELEVSYQIHAGEEPTIAKWFSFVHHRKSRFLIESATVDKWLLPEGWSAKGRAEPSVGVFADTHTQEGDVLLSAGLEPGSEIATDGHSVAAILHLYAATRTETPLRTAKSLTAFWHGGSGVGAFLYQLYVGQYVTRSTPETIPIAYNTRFAYRDQIDAATCEKIIPLAAQMGIEAFVLDDGWQSNRAPDSGRYGDWLTDKFKFPQGLLPVSTLARVHKMRFGLWTDASIVNASAQAETQHPEWLYTALPNAPESRERMCFTGAWAGQFAQSFRLLCREQGITYLKASFEPDVDCMATTHEHPTGHSLRAQSEAWAAFNEVLHGVDKSLVIVSAAGSTRPHSFFAPDAGDGWLPREWLDPYALPFRNGGSELWKALARGAQAEGNRTERGEAGDALLFQPTFTLCGQALCHIAPPGPQARDQFEIVWTRDQLDYLWSSVAGRYAAYEVQGHLDRMSGDERETAHKWLEWTRQNREWLAYTQTLTLDAPAAKSILPNAAASAIRGTLHLRNAVHGRYGYVCVWNPGDVEAEVTPSFDPADYFVRIKPGMQVVNTSDRKSVPYSTHGGTISLGKITLPAYGWAIYEIKAK